MKIPDRGEASGVEGPVASHQQLAGLENRTIRVFVSSTFRDMQAERDVLVKKIFPQLRKLCEERSVTWTDVDLRWGITTEEASEGKVLPLCLAEIQRCRPYFIGLLGERYGWVPEESEIPQDLLEIQPWLKDHLEHSVTELEILHGVLLNPGMAKRSLFYFRDPAYVERLTPEERHDFTTESTECAEKLKKLKDRIREASTSNDLLYAPREDYADPEALGAMILADFTAIIDQLYPTEDVRDPLDQEATRHEGYARSRRSAFVGREDLVRQMDEHMVAAGAQPLVLIGESGCGKSALLAEWVARWRAAHPGDLVIEHYIGSTPESADWEGLVRRVLGEIKRVFAIADDLPVQPGALRTALQNWLTKASGQRRVVIVIDALNQLSSDDAAARQLGWLPAAVPLNVRLLVSSLPGECLDALHRRNWPELAVPLFSRADISRAAKAYFDLFSKKLPREILAKLESTPAATNALYLRAVLDELRQFGRHEQLEATAAGYLAAPDLPALFDRILTRWDDDFGQDKEHPDLVRRSLCLIACARFGLSEPELLDLLGQRGDERLPQRYWTPLYLAAESALAQRAGLLTFGHDYLRAAVHRRWLTEDVAARAFRLKLASLFTGLDKPSRHGLDELPALLRDTGQWEHLKGHVEEDSAARAFRLKLADYYEGIPKPTDRKSRAVYAAERHILEVPGQTWLRSRLAHLTIFSAFDELPALLRDMAQWEHLNDLLAEDSAARAFRLKLADYFAGILKPTDRKLDELPVLLRDTERSEHLEALLADLPTFLRLRAHGRWKWELNGYWLALDYPWPGQHSALAYGRALSAAEPDSTPERLACLLDAVAGFHVDAGHYREAEPLLRRALEIRERVLGPEHPDTLTSMTNLADLLWRNAELRAAERNRNTTFRRLAEWCSPLKGDFEDAAVLFRRALDASQRALGPEHPQTLASLHNLAVLLLSKGDAGTEELCRRVLEARGRVLGPEHPDTLTSMNFLAHVLTRKRDLAGAEQACRRALEIRERVLGPEHPDTLTSVIDLANMLRSQHKLGDADRLNRRAKEAASRNLGEDHPIARESSYSARLLFAAKEMSDEARWIGNVIALAGIGLGFWKPWLWLIGVPMFVLSGSWLMWRAGRAPKGR